MFANASCLDAGMGGVAEEDVGGACRRDLGPVGRDMVCCGMKGCDVLTCSNHTARSMLVTESNDSSPKAWMYRL